MATDPADPARTVSDPTAHAPLAGTRSQAMQRLQVGVFGLAAMLLLVGLANIIMTNARRNQAQVVPEAAPTVATQANAAPASDPLADAGVVPDMPAASRSTAPAPNTQATGAR